MSILNKLFHLLTDPEEPETKPAPAEAKAKAPTTLPDDHTLHKDDFAVVGVHHHEESLQKLAVSRPDYRAAAKKNIEDGLVMTRIWRYDYINKPVKLEIDPTDQFGTDRVMVFIAGEHVGYLSEDNDAHAREILQYGSIKYISARITGGDYKVVPENGETFKSSDRIRISVRIAYSV